MGGSVKARVLIVEDENTKRVVLEDALARDGYEVRSAADGLEGLRLVESEDWDIALFDLKLPLLDGMTLLRETRRLRPEASVIVMTAYGSIETAVEAMRNGAYDFLTKPFTTDELLLKLGRLLEFRSKSSENVALRKALASKHQFRNIVGESRPIRELLNEVSVVAGSDATVLLEGETGTGKELIAETIHYGSPRREGPFVRVSCVTLKDTLIESELFGHEKGAFSGAIRTRPGRFELAHKGTLFLDDIDDTPLAVQPKLLQVLQRRTFERVGGEKTLEADVRVIAATKRDLSALIPRNEFREDLYYRLATILLKLPPLRERKQDIPLFVEHFAARYDKGRGRRFSPAALDLLARHDWPGNIRELEHVVEATLVLAGEPEEIQASSLPKDFLQRVSLRANIPESDLRREVAEVERDTIARAMARFDGNISRAATYLNMARSTLRDRLRKLGITPPTPDR